MDWEETAVMSPEEVEPMLRVYKAGVEGSDTTAVFITASAPPRLCPQRMTFLSCVS
jgi:hypothetical protein